MTDAFSPRLPPKKQYRAFVKKRSAEGSKLPPLRYYNSAVHAAAFVLPEFARQAVAPHVVPGTGFQ